MAFLDAQINMKLARAYENHTPAQSYCFLIRKLIDTDKYKRDDAPTT